MMVTYEALQTFFTLCLLIVAVVDLVYRIYGNRK